MRKIIIISAILGFISCENKSLNFQYSYKPDTNLIEYYSQLWKNKIDNIQGVSTMIETTNNFKKAIALSQPRCQDLITDIDGIHRGWSVLPSINFSKLDIQAVDSLVFKDFIAVKTAKDTAYALEIKLHFHKILYKNKTTWYLSKLDINERFLREKAFTHSCFKIDYDVDEKDNNIVSSLITGSSYQIKEYKGKVGVDIRKMKVLDGKLQVVDYTGAPEMRHHNFAELIYSGINN